MFKKEFWLKKKSDSKIAGVPLIAKISLLVACFFWAASFIASKVALGTIPPLTVVSLRLLLSAFCFLIWIFFRRRKINIKNPAWIGRLFILSLFGTGLHYGIQTIGLQFTTASNASVYAVTGPISITLIAALFLGERITLRKTLGISLALVGVLIVMGLDTILAFDLKGHLLGDLLVFTSIIMWGIFTVLGKSMTRKMPALDLTTMVTVMGAAYMLPLGIIEMGVHSFSLADISAQAWVAVVFLGVTCSFFATLLYFYALEKTESQKVGVYLYTIPPMTAIIAAIFLGEIIGINLVIGAIVVLLGVYFTERG
jgi:drug/metabolite transporter (DMT)-like permease